MGRFTFKRTYFFVLLKWTFIFVDLFDGWRLSVWARLLLRLCLPGQMQHHYTTSCVVLLGCITVFIANSKNFLMLAIGVGWCTSAWGWVPLLKGRSHWLLSVPWLKTCEPWTALWPHLPAVLFQYRSKASCLYNLGGNRRGRCTSSFIVCFNQFN